MNIKAKLYVTAVSLAGLGVIGQTLYRWHSEDLYRFAFYLVLSALAAGLKVTLPGIRGTMSVCFLFVFIGIADLNAQLSTYLDSPKVNERTDDDKTLILATSLDCESSSEESIHVSGDR